MFSSVIRFLSRSKSACALAILAVAAAFFAAPALRTGFSQAAPSNASNSSAIIQFLSQTINWYRDLNLEHQIGTEPSDVLVLNDDRQLAQQVVRLAFDFARAQAQNAPKSGTPTQGDTQNPQSSQYQSLQQLSSKLDGQVRDLQTELDSLRRKLDSSTGHRREVLQTTIAEVQSELDLANARRDAVHNMADFVSGANTSGMGASGLRAQIEALARSVPSDLSETISTNQNQSSAIAESNRAAANANKPEPSGIWGLTGELFALSAKIRTIDQRAQATDALTASAKEFRTPLLNNLKQFTQQGDTLAKEADTADPKALAQMKKDLDALTAQFRQTSAAMLPLSKQSVLLGLYKASLGNWRNTVKGRYRTVLRGLIVRLVILAVVLTFVFGVAEVWRRTILRYIHEPRRRYQFLLLRKIVLWFAIILVIAFAFASQLGSVATFAGLLTAGVAVALQNVILSIAGYFFLIGRFGIRVGDRVQISGVTGEVVDIGLVRLHVMELAGGAESPTGRVVAFSNSIVFQPTAGLFKQIPGTNFVWHEITLTLAADSDYHVVEKRLLQVVETVFEDYREDMERQRKQMERTLSYTPSSALHPTSRLRLTSAGLEAVIRFPVTLQNATEIDDRVTRELLKAIDREPKLKLVGSSLRLHTDVVSTVSES